jgi:acetyl-CoA carboxylase carboxyl transferase subunit alpha
MLKLTAPDLKAQGLIDEMLYEPQGAAHKDGIAMARIIRDAITRGIDELSGIPPRRLIERRYARLRRIGEFAVREISASDLPMAVAGNDDVPAIPDLPDIEGGCDET